MHCSFYRKRRVEEMEFYDTLNSTLIEYDILTDDTLMIAWSILFPMLLAALKSVRIILRSLSTFLVFRKRVLKLSPWF